MKLLLDTHIWLWSVLDPSRLSRRAASALEAASNEKWLSPISVWETLVLADRGRVILEPDPVTWIRHELERLPFHPAPLTHEIAIESRRIELPHDDPADRFLAATALVHDLTFVTADARLLRCRGLPVLPGGVAGRIGGKR